MFIYSGPGAVGRDGGSRCAEIRVQPQHAAQPQNKSHFVDELPGAAACFKAAADHLETKTPSSI